MTTPRSDAEKLEREACKLFCIVFGAEEARGFEAMNPAIYNGWLRLARKLRKSKPKTCVWTPQGAVWKTHCGHLMVLKAGDYCSLCGGKIVTK